MSIPYFLVSNCAKGSVPSHIRGHLCLEKHLRELAPKRARRTVPLRGRACVNQCAHASVFADLTNTHLGKRVTDKRAVISSLLTQPVSISFLPLEGGPSFV